MVCRIPNVQLPDMDSELHLKNLVLYCSVSSECVWKARAVKNSGTVFFEKIGFMPLQLLTEFITLCVTNCIIMNKWWLYFLLSISLFGIFFFYSKKGICTMLMSNDSSWFACMEFIWFSNVNSVKWDNTCSRSCWIIWYYIKFRWCSWKKKRSSPTVTSRLHACFFNKVIWLNIWNQIMNSPHKALFNVLTV